MCSFKIVSKAHRMFLYLDCHQSNIYVCEIYKLLNSRTSLQLAGLSSKQSSLLCRTNSEHRTGLEKLGHTPTKVHVSSAIYF
uniref:Uncharacterized protein n=1 Tax=Pararge aegeria TaxID=116150 RepID=S4P8H8_9NEOP